MANESFKKRNFEMRSLKPNQASTEVHEDNYKYIRDEETKALFEIVKNGQTELLEEKLATIEPIDFLCCTVGYRHVSVRADNDGMTLGDLANRAGNEEINEILYLHAMKLADKSSSDMLVAKLTFNRKAEIDDLLARCDKNDEGDLEAGLFSSGFFWAANKGCFYAFQKIFERDEKNGSQCLKPEYFQKEYIAAWKYKDIRDYLETKFPDTNFRRNALLSLITEKAEYVLRNDHEKLLAIQRFIKEDPSLLTELFEGKTLEVLAMTDQKFEIAKYLCEKAEKTGVRSTSQSYYDFQYWKDLGLGDDIINASYRYAISDRNLEDVKRFIDKDPSVLERKVSTKGTYSSTLFALGCRSYEIAEYLVQEDEKRNQGKNNVQSFHSFKSIYKTESSSQSIFNSVAGFFSTMSSGINTGGYKGINQVVAQLKKEGPNNHDNATNQVLWKIQ